MVGRRGKKKALIAVGHKILIMIYNIIKYKVPYKELGINYLDRIRKPKVVRYYIRRLERLGYELILYPKAA